MKRSLGGCGCRVSWFTYTCIKLGIRVQPFDLIEFFGDWCDQKIPHRPAYPAGSAGSITLAIACQQPRVFAFFIAALHCLRCRVAYGLHSKCLALPCAVHKCCFSALRTPCFRLFWRFGFRCPQVSHGLLNRSLPWQFLHIRPNSWFLAALCLSSQPLSAFTQRRCIGTSRG